MTRTFVAQEALQCNKAMHENQKIKILYVITKSNFGGAQRYVYELATQLPRDRYDITVACGGSGELVEKLQSAKIHTIEVRAFQRDINILKELRAFRELWQILQQIRPDVIHLNSSKAVGIGAFVGRLAGIPRIVSTIHGWAFHENRNFLWRLFVWLCSYLSAILSHKIILVSEYDYLHTYMPFVIHKCSAIHTAIPTINFLEKVLAREQLFSTPVRTQHENDSWLISIAELTPNKNLATAITAIDIYNTTATQKIFYSIIGAGELEPALQKQINAATFPEHILLLGSIENARAYLRAFDIFLLPSHKEGLPYALLEAGAAGLACIGSNVGGIPEVIENEATGILIEPNDTESIVTALTKLTKNPQLQKQYGTAIRKKIEHEYGLTRMLEKTIAIYEGH